MNCSVRIARLLLIVFNVIFCLSGLCLVAFGIWLLVDKDVLEIFQLASVSQSGGNLDTTAYIMIGFGGSKFLVGIIGCAGARHRDKVLGGLTTPKCCLCLYIFFLVFVMIGELAAGIYEAIQVSKIRSDLKQSLKFTVATDDYIVNPNANPITYTRFANSMNSVQWRFDCCGVDGPVDYTRAGTTWPKRVGGRVRPFPLSCCEKKPDVLDLSTLTVSDVLNAALCYNLDSRYSHGRGCFSFINSEVKDQSNIVIGVCISLALLEIIGIACSLIMIKDFDKHHQ